MREFVPVGKFRPELPVTHAWYTLVVACSECDPLKRWSSADVVRTSGILMRHGFEFATERRSLAPRESALSLGVRVP